MCELFNSVSKLIKYVLSLSLKLLFFSFIIILLKLIGCNSIEFNKLFFLSSMFKLLKIFSSSIFKKFIGLLVIIFNSYNKSLNKSIFELSSSFDKINEFNDFL